MRAVIDTNVLFEGLTKQGGACGFIVSTWRARLIRPCVSNALVYEYEDVLVRKLSPQRWQQLEPVLKHLLTQVEPVNIHYSWRPSSPDPGDELVIDCALNADAAVVTFNRRDFRVAQQALGLIVLSPAEFVLELAK